MRNWQGFGIILGLVLALMLSGPGWLGLAQTETPPPPVTAETPSPRMEDFDEFQTTQFARVVALVFLQQEADPNGDIEVYRQEMIRACGLSPELYERMNYVFTGDPDFLYVVTRRISQIPPEELEC